MPYVPHVRATAYFDLGPIATPREQATCTTNFSLGDGVWTADRFQALAEDIHGDWATFLGTSTAEVSPDVILRYVKVWNILADGHYDGDTYTSTAAAAQGSGSGAKHPWQDSLVVTLDAGGHTPGRFGRFYLPPQMYQMDVDGLVTTGDFANIWPAVQTLCTNLSNEAGADSGFGLVVAGKTGVAGTLRPVESIRLGRVVDTQRRRRRSLAEHYSVVSFTP